MNRGVTFVELVVVFVVLAVVASVIVPQFSQAATESKVSHICEILQEVRSYITIYKAQHDGLLPSEASCGFENAMCGVTDAAGNLAVAGSGVQILGPYMERMPANPYNGLNTVDIDGEIGDGSHGWHFDRKSGLFKADDSIENAKM